MASSKLRFDKKEDYTLSLVVFIAFVLLARLLTIPAPLETQLSQDEQSQIALAEEISTSEAVLYANYNSATEYLAQLKKSLIPETPCEERLVEFSNQKDFLYYLDYEFDRMKDISGLGSCLTLSGFPHHLLDKASSLALKLEKSVLEIQAGSKEIALSYGTAYAIAPNLVLTNFHIATSDDDKPYSSFTVTTFNGKKYDAIYLGGEKSSDVALFKIATNMEDVSPIIIADSNKDSLEYGEPVFSIGHPNGFGMWKTLVGLHYGQVINSPNDSGSRFSLPSAAGSSGSPIFNMKGELVSMMSGYSPIAGSRAQKDLRSQYHKPIHTGIVSNYSMAFGAYLPDIEEAVQKYAAEEMKESEPKSDK